MYYYAIHFLLFQDLAENIRQITKISFFLHKVGTRKYKSGR